MEKTKLTNDELLENAILAFTESFEDGNENDEVTICFPRVLTGVMAEWLKELKEYRSYENMEV